MCWNFDEEKISRTAAFITDCSHDKRCDETPVCLDLGSYSIMEEQKMEELPGHVPGDQWLYFHHGRHVQLVDFQQYHQH